MAQQRIRIVLFQLALLLACLAVMEVVLRGMGYRPGDIKPNWLNFHPVDSLYVIGDYYTNGDGILIADSGYWAKKNTHINAEGFRSPDLDKLDTAKKKVLFIGDSFTWGCSAVPIEGHCFVDLLRSETPYEIINMGIPAADPPQYFEITKKYIPSLKPDFVLVVFFMGNDLMPDDRKVVPNEPFYYYTNAGALLADIDGIHFKSAKEVYNYIVNDKYYLHKPRNLFERIIAHSALLSRLYAVKFRIEEKIAYEQLIRDTHITKNSLKGIRQIAGLYHVPLRFVLIPEVKEANMNVIDYEKRYRDILLDTVLKDDWLIRQNSKKDFNDYPDAHLNNAGHRHYADFLKGFLSGALH